MRFICGRNRLLSPSLFYFPVDEFEKVDGHSCLNKSKEQLGKVSIKVKNSLDVNLCVVEVVNSLIMYRLPETAAR